MEFAIITFFIAVMFLVSSFSLIIGGIRIMRNKYTKEPVWGYMGPGIVWKLLSGITKWQPRPLFGKKKEPQWITLKGGESVGLGILKLLVGVLAFIASIFSFYIAITELNRF